MDTSTHPIADVDKQRLVEYLIEKTLAGISGRDGAEIIDAPPQRVVFSGVLKAPRAAEIKATETGTPMKEAPDGAAIGVDFRLRPTGKREDVRLRIRARWSHYFAVFPTWEQYKQGNVRTIGVPTEVLLSVKPQESEDPTQDPPEGEGSPSETEATHTRVGRKILPRVFKRLDAEPDIIEVHLAKEPANQEVGQEALDVAIQGTLAAIASEPRAWKHIAEPTNREREIPAATAAADAESYLRALEEVAGTRVEQPPWKVSLQVECADDPSIAGAIRLKVLLSNATTTRFGDAPDPDLVEASLFDALLTVEVEGGTISPFDFLLAPADYRCRPRMPAKGINCSVQWSEAKPHILQTEALPLFKQPLYRTRDESQVAFDSLDATDLISKLESVGRAMDSYSERWKTFLASDGPRLLSPEELASCTEDHANFLGEVVRFRLGLEALGRDSRLLEAFRLMNRTFSRLGAASQGKLKAWRLFQVGFIVSQLPSLAIRDLPQAAPTDYEGRLREEHSKVGVLWFPTGGGKTEAYLGLLATALLFDRLRGKERGVCAWMRFPLRMLSLQQLERLARVVAVLNVLRAEVPGIRKGDPFSIGYFVGQDVTPNRLDAQDMGRFERDAGLRDDVRLLRKCPFCGDRLEVQVRRESWRLAHQCSNAKCFSNTSETLGDLKGTVPLFIVDNEIYRYLPSVLVGTVDKLAIVSRSRGFVHIVRGPMQKCKSHGYASYDECIERWGANCKAKKRDLANLTPFKDPGLSLLVQDELHLLKAELGVFNGHYEGLLNYLGERAHLPPKVLAATATIEAYDTQAFHIYLRTATRFPQPGWELGESFYATSRPAQTRRYYVGVRCHTRGIEDPALQVLAVFIREVRRLARTPRQAAAIMRREDLGDAAILDVLRLYDFSLAYVNRKATGGNLIDKLKRIERFLAVEGLGAVEGRSLTGDQRMDEVGTVLDRIERERLDTGQPRLSLVAATNLISHGVDLERINMMVVCGLPSHYAEYVQSTSRAARSHPGVVFVCFKAKDPRENSQYEFFTPMHEHLDRLIEAVAVNRFASFAPRKTVPGLLCGLLLCDFTPDLFASKKITKSLDHVPTLQTALGLKVAPAASATPNCLDRGRIAASIKRIIGVDKVYPPASAALVANVSKCVDDVLNDIFGEIGRTMEARLPDVVKPIISFRDVDEGLDFYSTDSASMVTRLRR